MSIAHDSDGITVHLGDCLDVLPKLSESSIDAVVCDPPYELAFMAQKWDSSGIAFNPETWRQVLRVLKPGGHLLAFGATRSWHRLAAAIEDAGFEIRDSIAWLTGSGFPKSLNVSKAIDKAAGAEREVIGHTTAGESSLHRVSRVEQGYRASLTDVTPESIPITAPATDDAQRWQGWGTALKPGHEPCVVAQKPLSLSDMCAKIGSQLDTLEVAWLARAAEPLIPTGEAAGSNAQTGTSPSVFTAAMCSNTVTSWRESLAELYVATNTCTTETMSRMTTDLRTLSYCLGRITHESTTPDLTNPHIASSLVSAADNLFAASIHNLRTTLALSAAESAIANTPTSRPDEGAASPAFEPIVVARKPLVGTVAGNVLEHGVGALNIDACRIPTNDALGGGVISSRSGGWDRPCKHDPDAIAARRAEGVERISLAESMGRWPANVVLDESQAAELDKQSGMRRPGAHPAKRAGVGYHGGGSGRQRLDLDSGGASRFFYVAKAPAKERPRLGDGTAHPTVKPLDLMRWLVRLVTTPGGVVLDPFLGSGTTAEACYLEGFTCIGIERDERYIELIKQRLNKDIQVSLFGGVDD